MVDDGEKANILSRIAELSRNFIDAVVKVAK